MKYIILLASICFSAPVWAISECAGRASDGTFVMIHINTATASGIVDQGEVSFERGGNKFGYRFGHDEVPQYFEFDEASNGSALVGVSAFVQKEFPISVKYVGINFIDMDLKTVVDEGQAKEQKSNVMRIWKGPGHAATDQYQLTQIACSVWANL